MHIHDAHRAADEANPQSALPPSKLERVLAGATLALGILMCTVTLAAFFTVVFWPFIPLHCCMMGLLITCGLVSACGIYLSAFSMIAGCCWISDIVERIKQRKPAAALAK